MKESLKLNRHEAGRVSYLLEELAELSGKRDQLRKDLANVQDGIENTINALEGMGVEITDTEGGAHE